MSPLLNKSEYRSAFSVFLISLLILALQISFFTVAAMPAANSPETFSEPEETDTSAYIPQCVIMTVEQPSQYERIFAEGRDFYVKGNFTHPQGVPIDIKISLADENGNTIRMIKSNVNADGITDPGDVDMSLIDEKSRWGDVLAPDLIVSPLGYANAENKLLVTGDYYHGMIQGGVSKETGTYNVPDADGSLKEIEGIITAGRYTLIIEAFEKDGSRVMITDDIAKNTVMQNLTVDVEFGITNASFGRFSPAASKEKLIGYARENDRRVYLDWFPGYYSAGAGGYEIKDRWQRNNAIEAVNTLSGTKTDNPASADNTLLVYNIGEKSATYQVETAAILGNNLADSPKTKYLYYDIGEPEAVWRDSETLEVKKVSGKITDFPTAAEKDDYGIIFTHADISGTQGTLVNGEINISALDDPRLDIRVDDTPYGVRIKGGEEVIFYGVSRPIPSKVIPMPTADRGVPEDQVMTYTYTNDDLGTFTYPAKLTRIFAGGYTESGSNYEFGHLMPAALTANLSDGEHVFKVAGFDRDGNFVKGTATAITLSVYDSQKPVPVSPISLNPISVSPLYTDPIDSPLPAFAWGFSEGIAVRVNELLKITSAARGMV